jgi:hypothetical protein
LSVNWKGKFKQIELGFFDFFFYVEKIEIMWLKMLWAKILNVCKFFEISKNSKKFIKKFLIQKNSLKKSKNSF